jgi:hypothetical protein
LLSLAPLRWAKARERVEVQKLLDQDPVRKLTLDQRG